MRRALRTWASPGTCWAPAPLWDQLGDDGEKSTRVQRAGFDMAYTIAPSASQEERIP
jgi:hypothetical protein